MIKTWPHMPTIVSSNDVTCSSYKGNVTESQWSSCVASPSVPCKSSGTCLIRTWPHMQTVVSSNDFYKYMIFLKRNATSPSPYIHVG